MMVLIRQVVMFKSATSDSGKITITTVFELAKMPTFLQPSSFALLSSVYVGPVHLGDMPSNQLLQLTSSQLKQLNISILTVSKFYHYNSLLLSFICIIIIPILTCTPCYHYYVYIVVLKGVVVT